MLLSMLLLGIGRVGISADPLPLSRRRPVMAAHDSEKYVGVAIELCVRGTHFG